jgi:sugar phosphate isomerase/epimerase
VKGWDRTGNMSEVTADNSIDWKALFAHSKQAGIEHYFVEHDEAKDELASIATSFRYLQQLRF